jgi:hypothetical protein
MRLSEFEERFDTLWREKYALYDPACDHWTQQRKDARAKQQCRDLLLEYAAGVRQVGVLRRSKNKAQRLFEELGIDPCALDPEGTDAAGQPAAEAASTPARGRIMYIECKAKSLKGEARIGRVTYSGSGRTLYYRGRSYRSLRGSGCKANYYCVETGEHYWISGCKRDGADRLYGERIPVCIDDEVREEYWTEVRGKPECKAQSTA